MDPKTTATGQRRWSIGARALLLVAGFALASGVAAMAFFVVSVIYGPSNNALAQATSLSAPTTPTSTETAATTVKVGWTQPVSQLPGASYQVTASPGRATCTSSGTSCPVPGLAAGTAYTFSVVAVLDNWQSSPVTTAFTTLGVTTASLPDGVYGSSYSTTVAAIGGTGADTWTLTSGSLTGTGLSLNTNGNITGTPTSASTISGLGFTVTDAHGFTATSGLLSLVVHKAPLTITASSDSMTYGGTVPTITPSYSGFVNGDTSSSLTPAPSCSTAATSSSSVAGSPYTSSCSSAVDSNYTFNYQSGSVTVNKAVLTVTANPASMTYGAASLPTFSDVITGFVNGDTSSAVSGSASLTTTAIHTSAAGSYTITAALGSLSAANYKFSFANGSLTINPAPLTITASSGSMTYGATVPTITPSYSGFVNGDTSSSLTPAPSCSTAAMSSSSVAGSPYTSSCSSAVDSNYTFNYPSGSVTVAAATPTNVVNDNATQALGQSVTFTATVTGPAGATVPTGGTVSWTVSGTAGINSCTTSSTTTLNGSSQATCVLTTANAGTYVVSDSWSGNSNYNSVASGNDPVIVAAATPTNVVNDNATQALGQSVTFRATVTGPAGATAPTGGTVSWTVSGSAGVTSCTTSSTTTLNGSSQATCVLTTANAGTYVVSDSWSGNSNYNSVASGNDPVIVAAATPTNVVNDNATQALGQSVTFRATVTGPAGATAPTGGTVSWTVSGSAGVTSCTTSSTTTLNGSSQATCVLTTANAGTYVVSDSWGGNSNYNSVASGNDSFTVAAG
jgi:hypothetical protein